MANHTILLIDYSPPNIERVRRPLQEAGYEVAVAQDGLAGLDAFRHLRPSLAIVEAMLPKKHGYEVCKKLKGTPEGKTVPMLVLTSTFTRRAQRVKAMSQYGFDGFLEKPVQAEHLLAVVESLLPLVAPAPVPSPPLDQREGPTTSAEDETTVAEEKAATEATPAEEEKEEEPVPVAAGVASPAAPSATRPSSEGESDGCESEIMDRLNSILGD